MNQLRADLEPLPDRMKVLPIDRGYPVPWFVQWLDRAVNDEPHKTIAEMEFVGPKFHMERYPEFRAFDREKFARALRERLCWVCGQVMGRYLTFVAGPMCGINRTSAEPPCHLECAQYSARNCPFLSKPNMERREMEGSLSPAGHMISRNPGVTLLWTTRSFSLFGDGRGGVLIRMGLPIAWEWWALGKPATRAQVEESIRTGLPHLERLCDEDHDPEGARRQLHQMAADFTKFYPKE